MKNALAVIAVIALICALSWAICTGILYFIFLCFSWNFTILKATGIWLIMCLVGIFLPSNKK